MIFVADLSCRNGNHAFFPFGNLLDIDVVFLASLSLPDSVLPFIDVHAATLLAALIDAGMLVGAQVLLPSEELRSYILTFLLLSLAVLDLYDFDFLIVVVMIGSTGLLAENAGEHAAILAVTDMHIVVIV